MMWEILKADAAHVDRIAANMRADDRREVWASDRRTPGEALRLSLGMSQMAWTCLVRGEPAFMWGVSRPGSILSVTGVPWLLGTDEIVDVRREFLRQSRGFVDLMQAPFERLENYVHADNRLSRRWLKWCGFTLDPEAVRMNGEDFYRFWRDK
jgi:hypothetical protein